MTAHVWPRIRVVRCHVFSAWAHARPGVRDGPRVAWHRCLKEEARVLRLGPREARCIGRPTCGLALEYARRHSRAAVRRQQRVPRSQLFLPFSAFLLACRGVMAASQQAIAAAKSLDFDTAKVGAFFVAIEPSQRKEVISAVRDLLKQNNMPLAKDLVGASAEVGRRAGRAVSMSRAPRVRGEFYSKAPFLPVSAHSSAAPSPLPTLWPSVGQGARQAPVPTAANRCRRFSRSLRRTRPRPCSMGILRDAESRDSGRAAQRPLAEVLAALVPRASATRSRRRAGP